MNRINRLKLALPKCLELVKAYCVIVRLYLVAFCCFTDNSLVSVNALCKLDNECTIASSVKFFCCELVCELKAYLVTKCHFCNSLRYAAVGYSPA